MIKFGQKTTQLSVLVFMLTLITTIAMAGEVTLVGEVNDNFQLYSNGQIYEVEPTPVGDDLVTNYISEKVEVVAVVKEVEVQGIANETEKVKVITVKRFRVVPE
jgi:hypothetical protein